MKLQKSPFLFLFASTLLIIFSQNSIAGCNDEMGKCLLGIFPHTSMKQVETTYSTIAEEIELILDKKVIIGTSSTIDKYAEKLLNAEYDVVLIGAGHFLYFGKKTGYIPIAKRRDNLRYDLITRPNSPLETLKDIKGMRLGLQDRISGSFLATTNLLTKNNLNAKRDTTVIPFTSQQACVHALITNKIDICSTARPVKEIFELKLNKKFKILASTKELPNITYAVHPRLGEERINALRDYFLQREGFVASNADEYEAYRLLPQPKFSTTSTQK